MARCFATTILGRILAPCLLAAVSCALGLGRLPAADEVPTPGVVLWDTGRDSNGAEVDFGGKATWQRVDPGVTSHSLRGDVVVENERLAVSFCRGSGGPLLCPKSAAADRSDRSRLVPVAPSGEAGARLTEIEIQENDEEGVALEVSARTRSGAEIRTLYSLAPGQEHVECKPVQSAAQIRIEAAVRFAVIPDFFGADMVFDPRAYSQAKLIIPPENFVLGLLEGQRTIVMSVWPTADQDAGLCLAGAKDDRRIDAMEIAFNGKSVYVAMLHAPGIWHERRLPDPYIDEDVSLRWNRPFPAKWRANFCFQRRNDSWDFQNHKTSTWMYLYSEIVWPCWFDGASGFVRLSKRFINVKGAVDFVLVYPSDRTRDTPLTMFTPVDIARNTLGVGPCEYVLDREGLEGRSANTGRKNFGRGVCDTTAPIEYLFLEGIETRESALVGHLVDDILADIRAINGRAQEFRRFGQELRDWIAATPSRSGPAAQLIAEAEKSIQQIETLYEEKLPVIKNPDHADQIGRRIKQLASRSDPENIGECKTLTYELRDIGGTQHRLIGDYRVVVKRFRQEAGILGVDDPSTAKMAEEVRRLGAKVLRKKYGVEAD